jgi:DNA processing protein
VEHFGGAEAVFHASLTELGKYRDSDRLSAVDRHRKIGGAGAGRDCASWVSRGDRAVSRRLLLPPRQKEIYDPPLMLYVSGNPEVLVQSGIAMVGTRHLTPYGTGMAERLACDLAAQ